MTGRPDELIGRIADAGFLFEVNSAEVQLVPARRGTVMPPELLAELTANREAVIARIREVLAESSAPAEPEVCRVCGRETDAEDRAVLATNSALCDRGEGRATTDAEGVRREATERCPYKRLSEVT